MESFSPNLMQFDETQSLFPHDGGRLVNFNNSLLVIGGGNLNIGGGIWNIGNMGILEQGNSEHGKWILGATVEELDERTWKEQKQMTPVNKLNVLRYFSVISIEDNLYIFGLLQLKKQVLIVIDITHFRWNTGPNGIQFVGTEMEWNMGNFG